MKATPLPTRSVTNAMTFTLAPSGLCTQTIAPSRTPLLLASTVLISTNMFCCSSASQGLDRRSEEHTSELQSLMRTSYAVFCLKKKIDIAVAGAHDATRDGTAT